ncbi:hypothetical protein BJX64DRAFT_286122, partial [Aspergillus heterothallicus]
LKNAFTLRPHSIITTCFQHELACTTTDKSQNQPEPTPPSNPPEKEKKIPTLNITITPHNLGLLIHDLLALAHSTAIAPSTTEAIFRTVYRAVQNLLLEEALFPIGIAIARAYIERDDDVPSALGLLESLYGARGAFRSTKPDGGMADASASASARAMFTATPDRHRVSLYPVARMILELKESRTPSSASSTVQKIPTVFRRQVWGLRKQFRNAPVLLIGETQVALFPWEFMHDNADLLTQGIWANDGTLGIPGCVRAVVKVTKWGFAGARENLLEATARAYGVSARAAFWRFEGGLEGGGGMMRLVAYLYGLPPGSHGTRPAGADADVEERLALKRAGDEAEMLETRRKLVSGDRGTNPLNIVEIRAAAGDYAAERVVVDLIAEDTQCMRNQSYLVCGVLSMFHLGTVLRLLRGVEGEWELSEVMLEHAAQNVHSGAGILIFLFEQRGSEFEVEDMCRMQVIVKVAANNDGNGRQIMEMLRRRQEARDRAAYKAFHKISPEPSSKLHLRTMNTFILFIFKVCPLYKTLIARGIKIRQINTTLRITIWLGAVIQKRPYMPRGTNRRPVPPRDPANTSAASRAATSGQTGSYIIERISSGCAVSTFVFGTYSCIFEMSQCRRT